MAADDVTTASMSAEEKSNALRIEGNALYKNLKLALAVKKYSEAAKLTPKSPVPLRNLSAAYFEAGKYNNCRLVAEKAIKLEQVAAAEDQDVQILKLKARIERAEKFDKDIVEAEEKECRKLIRERIGKYKGSLVEDDAYFTVGHDAVLSIFDETIEHCRPEDEKVSFIFGGIGDARNLLYTIIHIGEMEMSSKVPQKRYHFLINDHNVNVLARDLIIILLIHDLSKLDSESDEAVRVLNTIFFVYNAVMMPICAYDHLQDIIRKLLKNLRKGDQPLPWFFIYESDRSKFIAALESWSAPSRTPVNTSEVISAVKLHKLATGASPFTPPECKKEEKLYNEAAILFPPESIQKKYDPGFLDLVKSTPATNKNGHKFRKYLEEHWGFNTTLVDSSLGTRRTLQEFDFGHDPFQLAPLLDYSETPGPPGRKILYDHVAPFFIQVSKSIKQLEGRFQIEAVLGDCAEICEGIQYGLYDLTDKVESEISDKLESSGNGKNKQTTPHANLAIRPKDFPNQFDRAHLSNVPDYVGGHLSTFLYVAPLLKKSPSSYLTANCLRNSASWESIEDYLSEYQLITTEKMLDQLCQIRIMDRGEGSFFPMACFTYYGIISPHPHPFSNLLPKESFQKWFYALFFKLALPMPNDLWNVTAIIFSPLNLSIVPRLVSQLVGIGYPAHWLAECLQNVLANNVITTGRPPRKIPLRPVDADRNHAPRKLDTSPFVAEMSMLLTTFAPLLPFSTTSSPLKLPNLNTIYRYNFHLPNFDLSSLGGSEEKLNCVALLIWDQRQIEKTKNARSYMDHIRPLLDPSWDEVNSKFKDEAADKLRAEGLFLYTTIEWDGKKKVASAWMEKKVIDGMMGDIYWGVTLVRTDTWAPVHSTVSTVVDSASRGEVWS